jgi:hypothetical protein
MSISLVAKFARISALAVAEFTRISALARPGFRAEGPVVCLAQAEGLVVRQHQFELGPKARKMISKA